MNTTNTDDSIIDPIDLRQYFYLLWQWAWLIILTAILTGGAVYMLSSRQTPVYQAATTIMVNAAPSTQNTDYTSILASQGLTATYAKMINSQPVMDEVAKRLDEGITGKVLKGVVFAQPVSGTQLVSITVIMSDPIMAAAVANATAQIFGEQIANMQSTRFDASRDTLQAQMVEIDQQIKELTRKAEETDDQAEQNRLQGQISQNRDIYSRLLVSYEQVRLTEAQTVSFITQIEPATPPTTPISPRTMQNTQLGCLAGALLAVSIIILMEALNDSIRDPDVFFKKYNLPILGVIAHHQQQDGSPITSREPRSPTSEAFRTLRTNVQYASVDRPLRTLLITSPTPTDGKSTITSNLAVVLAQGGSKVCVVDADLRRPNIHRMLGTENEIGLSTLFVHPTLLLKNTMQKNQVDNIYVISSGMLPPNPAELLASKKMREILAVALEQSDIVLLDTPPVLSVTDAAVLAPDVDGVLLVVKPWSTKQNAFRQTIQQLNQVGANVLGVVINEVGGWGAYYNYHYRRYYRDQYAYQKVYTGFAPRIGKGFRLFRKNGNHTKAPVREDN